MTGKACVERESTGHGMVVVVQTGGLSPFFLPALAGPPLSAPALPPAPAAASAAASAADTAAAPGSEPSRLWQSFERGQAPPSGRSPAEDVLERETCPKSGSSSGARL